MHRDVKPENVMIRADGFVKVLDFGIARRTLTDAQSASAETVEAPLTTAGHAARDARLHDAMMRTSTTWQENEATA